MEFPKAFAYYLRQEELWNTKFIDDKLAKGNKKKSPKRKPQTKEKVVVPNNAEKENIEQQQSVEQDDNKQQEGDESEDDIAQAFTFDESNVDENAGLGVGTPKRNSRTRSLSASYSDHQGSSTKNEGL